MKRRTFCSVNAVYHHMGHKDRWDVLSRNISKFRIFCFGKYCHIIVCFEPWDQWWANLDQASKDLDKTIFRNLSPTPIP